MSNWFTRLFHSFFPTPSTPTPTPTPIPGPIPHLAPVLRYRLLSTVPAHKTKTIIHCSATPISWMKSSTTTAKVDEITRWHKARGFTTIGYNFVIDTDGTIRPCRALSQTGAHTKGHNYRSIGICLIGGGDKPYSRRDKPTNVFPLVQLKALKSLTHALLLPVLGHHELDTGKECPSCDMDIIRTWLEE